MVKISAVKVYLLCRQRGTCWSKTDEVVISCRGESAAREESCLDGVLRYFWKNSHGIGRHGPFMDEVVVNFSCRDFSCSFGQRKLVMVQTDHVVNLMPSRKVRCVRNRALMELGYDGIFGRTTPMGLVDYRYGSFRDEIEVDLVMKTVSGTSGPAGW